MPAASDATTHPRQRPWSYHLQRGLMRLLWVVLVLALGVLLALYLSVQETPLVAPQAPISSSDVARANEFLRRNDPRRARPGTQRSLIASEAEVNLLLNQLGNRYLRSSTQVVLRSGVALVRVSMELQPGPFGRWLNVDATLRETAGLPQVERLRIGHLPVPAWVADLLLQRLASELSATHEGQLAQDIVKQVRLGTAQVRVVYEWRDDTYQRLLSTVVPAPEQARLKAYTERLAEFSETPAAASGSVSLAQVLPPMFQLARQRSQAGNDPVAENRAALMALAVHAAGRSMSALVPAARTWRQPRPLMITLWGRDDFPQHLLVSAALAVEGGGPLADAIGVYKEVADARSGSGFSFNDIAADRAGSRLGQRAKQQAVALQARLAQDLQEADLMPDVSDLPEFLREADFLKTYGGLNGVAYRQMLTQIEQRLDALPLLAR